MPPITRLTTEEARVLDHVDDSAVVASLTQLIEIPSIGGSAAEVDIQHVLARQLSEIDMSTDLWPLDLAGLAADPSFPGVEVERSEAWGLVGESHPGERPALVVQGHTDVVPAGDRSGWTYDPFVSVNDGVRVVGRGACDMKAGVAAALGAVRALQRAAPRLARGFAVHFGVGEEDGGLGAYGTLARGHTGDACIIPEPTGLELVTGNAGALTFRIEVPGLATHGSTAYAGSSAIDSYLAIHAGLNALQERRNRHPEPLMTGFPIAYPLSVGRLQAGDWASTVPDLLVAEGRYGLRISEDPETARLELEEVVSSIAMRDAFLRHHPPTVSWPGGQFRGGQLPAGHELRQLVSNGHHAITGRPLQGERGASWGSDLRLYAGAGIPTLHYGPGDVRLAHGANEWVPVDEVLTATRVLCLSILRSCQVT